jgi:nucleoside-diphosphate-sugar epimerase
MTLVAVTGAAGLLGSAVAAGLVDAGYEVRGIDMVSPRLHDFEYIAADLTDPGTLTPAFAGAEVVVHAAAIPRPTGHQPAEVLRTNVLAAANVADAAVDQGASRLVNASSFSVLGWPFNPRPLIPMFLPIDESHPLAPQESYGLSKLLTEEIIAAAVRRSTVLTAVNLRMPWIQSAATFDAEVTARRADEATATGNLWSYIDVADAAEAFAAAIRADLVDVQSVYIAAPDTFMPDETLELVHRSFPEVELRRDLPGHTSVISSDRAERLLGIRPRRSWRAYDPNGAL